MNMHMLVVAWAEVMLRVKVMMTCGLSLLLCTHYVVLGVITKVG